MDITRENFLDTLPAILEQINQAEFISFDLEMTGIYSSDRSKSNRKDDLPSRRYENMIGVATKFNIIQVGLCTFKKQKPRASKSKPSYEASAYNIYMFPDGGNDIIMSPSSIDFLRKNGMDFGTWIGKGLSFNDAKGEEYLRKRFLDTKDPSDESNHIVLSRPNDINFFEKNWENLMEYVNADAGADAGADANANRCFIFEPCNRFMQRHIHEQVGLKLPNVVLSKTDDGRSLKATKLSTKEIIKHQEAKRNENENNFNLKMGFRLILKEIMNSKKPIVGHNCFFDILFILRWCDAPLEENFDAFRERLCSQLPYIYDTKYVATCGILDMKFDDTALNKLYEACVLDRGDDAVKVSLIKGCELNEEKFHDAGYDAYCTGCVFANELDLGNDAAHLKATCMNRLFMMQSLYHMNLDPTSPHGDLKYDGLIVHVSKFEKKTNTNDILAPFVNAGIKMNHLEAVWIDDDGIFVCIASTITWEELKQSIHCPKIWIMKSYDEFIEDVGNDEDKSEANGGFGVISSLMGIGRTISNSLFGGASASGEI